LDPYCLVSGVLSVYTLILIARIILSWTTMFWSPPAWLTPIVRVIYELTEPIMAFFRRFIPPIGGFDISPIIIFLIIRAIQSSFPC